MSLQSILLRRGAAKSDRERDSKIPYPTGVIQRCNISYGPYGKNNLLDVYRPDDRERYPILINVHGGGYVYGSKEVYKR
jgi:acetyl esterase/lipase